MANSSEARGSMSIEGDWTEVDVRNLLYVVLSQDGGEYYIHFDDADLDESKTIPKWFATSTKQLLSGNGILWYGCGRWSMQNNLESLHRWSASDFAYNQVKDLLSKPSYMRRRMNLIKAMKAKQLVVHWNVKDYEGGAGFIYEQHGFHTVNDEMKLDYNSSDTTYTDCNLKRYVAVMCDDDLSILGDAVYNLLYMLGLDESKWFDPVSKLISNHPTWYDLTDWIRYEGINTDVIPEQLGKDVMKLVNEGHV